MIIHFGDTVIDLGECKHLSSTFPLNLYDKQIGLRLTLETLKQDDLLACYACGDMMNASGTSIAASCCSKTPSYQIKLESQIQIAIDEEAGTARVETATCYAAGCEEHAIAVLLQLLFLAGVFTGNRLEAESGDAPEDDATE